MINVYPCFEHLNSYQTIYIYSDPHFDDKDLIFRHITSDEQVSNINSKVGRKDAIIFLGDIGNLEYINKIRGYKILIMGNHDTGSTKFKEVFNEVYDGIVCLNNKLVLSHEPVNIPFMFNIHGHDHNNKHSDSNHLNVCADHINFMPVSLTTLLKNGITSNITDIHRSTIDAATLKKKTKSK